MAMMQKPNMRMRDEEMPMRRAQALPAAMAAGQGQSLAETLGKIGAAAGGRDRSIAGLMAGLQGGALGSAAGGMKKGGKVVSASKRADGIAQRGKTKGRMC